MTPKAKMSKTQRLQAAVNTAGKYVPNLSDALVTFQRGHGYHINMINSPGAWGYWFDTYAEALVWVGCSVLTSHTGRQIYGEKELVRRLAKECDGRFCSH